VSVRLDRRGPRAQARDEAVQALVGRAVRGLRGRQVPRGVGEEIGAGVLDARGLRARQRMAADEARVVDGVDDAALDRADVADDALLARDVEHRLHDRAEHLHGRGHEGKVRLRDRFVHARARLADRAARDGRLAGFRRRVVAAHLRAEALAGGQADRATDQSDADDGDLHDAAALSTFPATAAARSTCSR
jgi:hypothetical protein